MRPPRASLLPTLLLALLLTLLLTLLLAFSPTLAHADTVSPADPNILYTGRWDESDPSAPWAQAQGSSLLASFEGTAIAVTMTVGSQDYFRVIIDGDMAGSVRRQIPSGVRTLLASDLPDGTHRLELVKETDRGRATLLELELDADKSLSAPPQRPSRRIVFYGDSNLAGYSLMSERNQGAWSFVGCHYGYAGITARMFDAEYHNISKSGATIQSLNNAYDRVDWNASTPLWSFGSFLPDLVVVNIGANDYWRPKSVNKANYHSLLDDLRAAHPAAHIMLYNSFGWTAGERRPTSVR